MTEVPLVSKTIAPANNFLWAVKCYLDLISGDGLLTPGSGLKRLYVMSSGLVSFNEQYIEATTQRAEQLKILPHGIRGFMHQSITRNISLYGMELHRMIAEQIVKISTGEVKNPPSYVTFNADEARRSYYVPPVTFLARLRKALNEDTGLQDFAATYQIRDASIRPLVNSLESVATDAELLLFQHQGGEGYNTPNETAWSSLMVMVERITALLAQEVRHSDHGPVYKRRARPALQILWVIAKLVMGDLSTKPAIRDTNLVDLDQVLKLSDGTLAALPFPTRETVMRFEDTEVHGLSMKARKYLSAVSAATFYRACPGETED